MVHQITRDELQAKIASGGLILLEALPQEYYDGGHLPGAHNLPLDAIDADAPQLITQDEITVVTYCSGPSCPNSRIAAERLTQLGYRNVYVYEGGKEDWTSADLPLERSSAATTT